MVGPNMILNYPIQPKCDDQGPFSSSCRMRVDIIAQYDLLVPNFEVQSQQAEPQIKLVASTFKHMYVYMYAARGVDSVIPWTNVRSRRRMQA